MNDSNSVEVSVVMPCLNEAETLERCIRKAQSCIERCGLSAEVLIADNGSTDGSPDIAARLGARVVAVTDKGYGSALRGGIEAARGTYIVMADADDSYDFSDFFPFIERLRAGADLVMGSRFKGNIMPGAMPWKHKWIGNPVLTTIGRVFFRSPASDFHCGLRAFSKGAYYKMELVTTGMEFASEMVIKATLKKLKIAEVPVVLSKDGRSRPPHLRSWHDGWRHLRFMLLYSPRWLFLVPAMLLLLLGVAGFALVLPGPLKFLGAVLDVHTLVVCSATCLIGYQLLWFGILARSFAASEGLLPPDAMVLWFRRHFCLERMLLLGLGLAIAGAALLVVAFGEWSTEGFGALNYTHSMRLVIPATTLLAMGVQTVFGSFFASVLEMGRRR